MIISSKRRRFLSTRLSTICSAFGHRPKAKLRAHAPGKKSGRYNLNEGKEEDIF